MGEPDVEIVYEYQDDAFRNSPRIDFQYVDRMMKQGENARKFAKTVDEMAAPKMPPTQYGSEP